MLEEQDPTTEYIKAFNNGYTMQQHEPDLLKKILSADSGSSEVLKAMKAGQRQFKLEQLKLEIEKSKSNQKGLERDK